MRLGRSTLELAQAQGWSPEQVEGLRDDRNLLYSTLLHSERSIFPNALKVVQDLASRVRMAVVTSSRREHVEIAHQRNGLAGLFEFILAWEDYQHSKPHPEPYQIALRRLNLPAESCVAIEDSERGLASALAAGLRCVVVPNELTRGCAFKGATALLPDLSEVPAFVAGL